MLTSFACGFVIAASEVSTPAMFCTLIKIVYDVDQSLCLLISTAGFTLPLVPLCTIHAGRSPPEEHGRAMATAERSPEV